MTYDLVLWPTDLNFNRDHLRMKNYLPTKFEASGVKCSWVNSCTRFRETDIPTNRRTCATQNALLFQGGRKINRDHLLIKDYLTTKFEASKAKHSWVISCTRYGKSVWHLNLTFDRLTWLSIGIIYLSWTIYLLSLKLVGQSIVELSGAQGKGDQHDLWPWPFAYWPEYQ